MLIKDNLFVEKYRPRKFEDLIGNEQIEALKKIREEPFSLPNLLLVSKTPGTGKTSLANVIVNELKADYLKLNASDERGIDVIRFKVKEFASTVSLNQNAPKIVWLDEADGLTYDAQNILRALIEDYSYNCRFIFTANNINRIIEPLRSRCQVINLSTPPKHKIVKRLKYICKKEGIKDTYIDDIIDTYYPDIRSMVKALDEYKKFGIINLESNLSIAQTIYNYIKQKKVRKAREYWLQKQIDYSDVLKQIFEIVLNDNDVKVKKKAIYIIAETSYRMAVGADAEITFTYGMTKLSEVIG